VFDFDVGEGIVVFDVGADVVGLEVGTRVIGWMLSGVVTYHTEVAVDSRWVRQW
jgi:hypothetical protein